MRCGRRRLRPDHCRPRLDGRGALHTWQRIPVATVVGMVADKMSPEAILRAFPDLEPDDVSQALHYAAEAVLERELPLLRGV